MMTVYPTLIAPLFNTYETMKEGPLRQKIEALAAVLGFPLKKLFVVDGSKRSGHSNAYMYVDVLFCLLLKKYMPHLPLTHFFSFPFFLLK